ncbi:arginine N-methyltransferase [Cryptosporidium ubiquitum]|uniref:Arginine N-methyltransferase n=1 Tax=Cryptosporidium ubiquitum TaxID=857276 RepID=A0A1J4MFQ5_9CRYT|nr:arginine N-methyltransferase [Cryptosporidium ubiquitum]OII72831.1 arginine N-methyltransferase [Cryptosporidium ubiquitum]
MIKPTEKELEEFKNSWNPLVQEDISSADYYFNSYAHFGIHEEMLKDSVRTGSYQKAIMTNKHLFQDKIVLDVGSGTGILCMFAAMAGAKHVYGIECSEIIHVARNIIKDNHFSDKITFIQSKAEEAVLPIEKVDIIVSEWMGYLLLYESMLDTVLFCRDKWLKEDGLIFPDRAQMYIAGIEDAEYKQEKLGYWNNVYGFNYQFVKHCIMEEPIIDTVGENAVNTSSYCILDIDLYKCKKEDLEFVSPFYLKVARKDFVHAFIVWFDIIFGCGHKPVTFTTGPFGRYTHWKQSVFYFEEDLVCDTDDIISGIFALKKNTKNVRDLDIKIKFNFTKNKSSIEKVNYYRLR